MSDAFGTESWDRRVNVRGSDLAAGLPKTLTLPASEFRRLWTRFVRKVATTVREALARCSPELAHDIFDSGIHLSGGAARTALLATTISDTAGVPVHLAAEPEQAVARGLAALVKTRFG